VFASLASVADVAIAERGSTIGFAGPRMVEHFTGHEIGSTSHTAASAFAAGLIDGLVDGSEIRAAVTSILGILRADDPHPPPPPLKRPARQISAWDAVQAIRSADRPHGPDLVREWADGFMELHGDRAGQDDEAVFCCVARPGGRRAAIVALDRRRWPGPGGYRKARRTFSLARRLKLPLVTIVDTNGADPSEQSESSGIASEIGKTLEALLSIEVPTLCVVTGEGGSGGALALAVSDHLAIYRDAIFSVLSPELAAEILWRDAAQAREAADALDPTAHRLVETGIADEIVDDDLSGRSLEETVGRWLTSLSSLSDAATSGTNITQLRRKRWRLDAL
jgi:acetyl-CoA carboxylase carboxyl transferase subunit beta